METTRALITIDYVSTDVLHPLYAHYDGQVTAQPSYVEIDLDSGDLSADYSGEVGSGVPERVWNGDVVRFDVDPHLTAAEINHLLGEIAPVAQKWIDDRSLDDIDEREPNMPSRKEEIDIDATFAIERLCERRTESGGIWDAGMWIEADGMNPPLHKDTILFDGINLRHDSTDAELATFAQNLRDIAESDLVTLANLDSYLIDQRDEARIERDKA